MSESPANIHPTFQRLQSRESKERLIGQSGLVIWLFGLSGAGKSTIAEGLEKRLHAEGRLTQLLDGDNIRAGLNRNLGFSDADREENIRRIAEVAKLHAQVGVVTLVSFITPKRHFRQNARAIIGADDYFEVYVHCHFETCEARDVKGLYAKAKRGEIPQFTGRDSAFETPDASAPADLVLETDEETAEASVHRLHQAILTRIRFPKTHHA